VSEHFVVDATIQMYPINGGGRKTPKYQPRHLTTMMATKKRTEQKNQLGVMVV